jgi:hypothetical protein
MKSTAEFIISRLPGILPAIAPIFVPGVTMSFAKSALQALSKPPVAIKVVNEAADGYDKVKS